VVTFLTPLDAKKGLNVLTFNYIPKKKKTKNKKLIINFNIDKSFYRFLKI